MMKITGTTRRKYDSNGTIFFSFFLFFYFSRLAAALGGDWSWIKNRKQFCLEGFSSLDRPKFRIKTTWSLSSENNFCLQLWNYEVINHFLLLFRNHCNFFNCIFCMLILESGNYSVSVKHLIRIQTTGSFINVLRLFFYINTLFSFSSKQVYNYSFMLSRAAFAP